MGPVDRRHSDAISLIRNEMEGPTPAGRSLTVWCQAAMFLARQ